MSATGGLVLSCVLLQAACRPTPTPLTHVDVSGGTREQAHAAAETLTTFSSWTEQPDDVALASVSFTALDGARGSYSTRRQAVELDEDLPAGDVAAVLRHELCHAWDHQAGWMSDGWPELEEAEQALPSAVFELDERVESWRQARREALATFCEFEPLAIRGLTTECGSVSEAFTGSATRIVEYVWPNSDDWEPSVRSGDQVISAPPNDSPLTPSECSMGLSLRSVGIDSGTLWASVSDGDRGIKCWEVPWPGGDLGEEAVTRTQGRWPPSFGRSHAVAIGPDDIEVYSVYTAGNHSEVVVRTADGVKWEQVDTGHCIPRIAPVVVTTKAVLWATQSTTSDSVEFRALEPL